uniref:Immunoglobulin V-set domain-containing protein n=1 Tax=Anolis carolinensis TaxID=28377 RepID=A0A803SQF5_ANOCA
SPLFPHYIPSCIVGMSPYLFETGEAYNERESVGLDCSLSIQGVQKEDAGFYTVLIDRGGNSTERGQFLSSLFSLSWSAQHHLVFKCVVAR